MRVLVIGSGGREHAICWKLSQSPRLEELYCAPGNPGMTRHAECLDIPANDIKHLADFAESNAIDLTVVGPEDPLAAGIVDTFQSRGLPAWGPSAAAAQLEASKAFAKDLMTRYRIPTAAYAEFEDAASATAYVGEQGVPIVVKADAEDVPTAVQAIEAAMIDRAFGASGSKIIIEECMIGEEASIFAFSDGTHILPLASSQDHKRIDDNDEGPNTGGMGAYSPAPVVTPNLFEKIRTEVLEPCIRGMAEDGHPYVGVLYAGLMMTTTGPRVVEFNCRFGDPETQVILPRMKSDIVPLLLACCDGTLDQHAVEWHEGACVTVVLASGGYPRAYEKGKVITGIEDAESINGVTVFHAGTKKEGERLLTNGGRVLNVTATGDTIPDAIAKAYQAAGTIHFEGAHMRSDIGKKALAHL